jgi:hypothetical protein
MVDMCLFLGLGLLPTKGSNNETDEKGGNGKFKWMLFGEVARQVESIVRLVFHRVDMSGRMLFDVIDDLSGISFEMIRIFDQCVACACKWVFGHIDNFNSTPGTNFSNGVYTPLATLPARTTLMIMNLLVILIVLMLLFGGGGFYLGGPLVGGGGFGLILLVLLVLFFTGRLGSR